MYQNRQSELTTRGYSLADYSQTDKGAIGFSARQLKTNRDFRTSNSSRGLAAIAHPLPAGQTDTAKATRSAALFGTKPCPPRLRATVPRNADQQSPHQFPGEGLVNRETLYQCFNKEFPFRDDPSQ